MLDIKGFRLGDGAPLVCVTVKETDRNSILDKVNQLKACTTQMIEWRVDWFEEVRDSAAVVSLLDEISRLADRMIVLVTYRSKAQGGEGTLEEKQVEELIFRIGKSKKADLIDIEYFEMQNAKNMIHLLHQAQARVVASHHNMKETPSMRQMGGYLEQMYTSGADIVRLTVMPKNAVDVAALLMTTGSFHESFPDALLITRAMGKLGIISQIGGETFGSCVTVGTDESAGAPGWINKNDLHNILTILHKSIAGDSDNIYLIGFSGTGKNAVSEELHKLTGRSMVDMDTSLAMKAGLTAPLMIERKGEETFRNMESSLLKEISKQSHLIVCCSDGATQRNSNISMMKNSGTVVLLTATARTVLERVRFDTNRPLLQGKKNMVDIQMMIDERKAAYDMAKDIEIATDRKTAREIAKEILSCITER